MEFQRAGLGWKAAGVPQQAGEQGVVGGCGDVPVSAKGSGS
jgi:hypothetical protein